MFNGLNIRLAGITLIVAVFAPLGFAQQTPPKAVPPGDWPMYGRDLTSSRYSPLTQITRANVSQLAKAWSYRPSAPAGNEEQGGGRGRGRGGAAGVVAEATPIVVNGVMYVPAGGQVVALDADTGKEIWSHRTAGGNVQTRSVGYWPGDRTNPARVLYTVGTKMFALNAATGNTDPGFGKEGVVDIEITWGGAPPKSYVQFPGVGSPNWGGTSADPTTGYVYVGTSDSALTGWIEKKVPGGNYGALTDGSPLPMDRGSVNGPGLYNQFSAGVPV